MKRACVVCLAFVLAPGARAQEAKVKVKPEAALERLMAGNKRFVADKAESSSSIRAWGISLSSAWRAT
jgi:hypothetical protein